jgi:tetratricopeptide (TPR) repeat protein
MKKIICIMMFLACLISIGFAESINDLLVKARKADENKKFEKAIDFYSKVLIKEAKNKEALYYRGLDYLLINEFDSAIVDFKNYIKIDTLNADAYNNLGLAKSYTDSILDSFNDFNKAIALDSNLAQAYINRAMVSITANENNAARIDLEKAQTLQPKNPSLYLQLALLEYKDKNFEKALQYYTNTINYGLRESEIYFKRGNTNYRLNNFQAAIADYTKAYNLDTTNFEAIGNRAMAYQSANLTDSAEIDRKFLSDMNKKLIKEADDGVDMNNWKYVFYPDSSFGMQLPSGFNIFYTKDSLANTYFFSLEEMKSPTDFYSIGGFIEMIRPTDSIVGTSNPEDLIEYWKSISTKNFNEFQKIQPVFTKTKPWGEKWLTIYTKTLITRTVKEEEIIYFNYGLVSDNVLLNVHFEVPQSMIWKYNEMFEKAVNTINVR